eukprot:2272144-Pyramimonas_sp.AAC.1
MSAWPAAMTMYPVWCTITGHTPLSAVPQCVIGLDLGPTGYGTLNTLKTLNGANPCNQGMFGCYLVHSTMGVT